MRTMRSISSVVTPGWMAACALSRMVLAMRQACLVPSICFAVLMGTAPIHDSRRSLPALMLPGLQSGRPGHKVQCPHCLAGLRMLRVNPPMFCCLYSISLTGTPVSA